MINELFRRGAEVVYEREAKIHVSGHASQDELKIMLSLVKPKFFMPLHGEYRHLMVHGQLAEQTGVEKENIFISDNGKVLELDANRADWAGTVPAGQVMVDGYGVGDVGTMVLKERKSLSEDGMIAVSMVVDYPTGKIITGPEVMSQGFIFLKESGEMIRELQKMAEESVLKLIKEKTGIEEVRRQVKDKIQGFLYKKTKRNPTVLPIIMDARPGKH